MTKIRLSDYIVQEIKSLRFDCAYDDLYGHYWVTSPGYYLNTNNVADVYRDPVGNDFWEFTAYNTSLLFKRKYITLFREGNLLSSFSKDEIELLYDAYNFAIDHFKNFMLPDREKEFKKSIEERYWVEDK